MLCTSILKHNTSAIGRPLDFQRPCGRRIRPEAPQGTSRIAPRDRFPLDGQGGAVLTAQKILTTGEVAEPAGGGNACFNDDGSVRGALPNLVHSGTIARLYDRWA